jgi:hypothetical protein
MHRECPVNKAHLRGAYRLTDVFVYFRDAARSDLFRNFIQKEICHGVNPPFQKIQTARASNVAAGWN